MPRRGRTPSTRCTPPPSTAGTTWGAHTTNVSASDEIGHFEYCDAIDADGTCTEPPARATPTLDEDDQFCLDGADFDAVIPIIGCLLDDGDFDGPVLPARLARDVRATRPTDRLHPTPMRFTVPTSRTARRWSRSRSRTTCRAIERGEPGSPTAGVRRA